MKYFLLFAFLAACSGGSSIEYMCPEDSGSQKPLAFNTSAYPKEKKIFDFYLDAPLPYPECRKYEYSGRVEYAFSESICFERIGFDSNERSCSFPENEIVSLVYPYKMVPDVVAGKNVLVVLSEGRVNGVKIATAGSSSVSLVLRELLNKYGKPVIFNNDPVYNSLGKEFSSAKATWKKDDYTIMYFGTVRDVDSGYILIMNPKGQSLYDRHMNKLLSIGRNNIEM